MMKGMDVRRLFLVALMSVFVLACSTPGVQRSGGVEVGSTAPPGSSRPPTPAVSGTPAPLATVLPAGSYRFAVGEAGVVTISLAGSGVTVESVEPHGGWVQQPDESAASGEVELRFVGPSGAELRFTAERDDDGTLDTRVRESTQAGGGQRMVASGDAGTVTFTIDGERLRVDDARANNQAGWHVVEDRIDEEGFSIALANAGRSTGIRFFAEVDSDGRLELETRTRTGPGYRSGLRDEAPEPTPSPTSRPTARPTPTDDDDEAPEPTPSPTSRPTARPTPTDDDGDRSGDDDDKSGPGGRGDDDDDDRSGPGDGGDEASRESVDSDDR